MSLFKLSVRKKHQVMKKLLSLCFILLTTTLCAFAQKVDYTTYNVVAKTKDVTVVVEDNNWMMVVGSLKKPKLEFHLGYTNEQAANKMDRLMDACSNEKYTKDERPVYFCGLMLKMKVTESGEDERYLFRVDNSKMKFKIERSEFLFIKNTIQTYKTIG